MTRWSNKELAEALGVTPQRISQLVKSRILPTPTKGHDPFTAVKAYIDFLNRRLTGGDLKAARIAKYQIETALRELEYKQKAGELVSKAAVSNAWFTCTRTTRDAMDNLAPRLSGVLASERNQERVFAVIQQEVRQIQEELTNGYATKNEA